MEDEIFVILLVEDTPSHAELVIRSFEDHQVPSKIYHVADGEAALDYLFRKGEYEDPEKSPVPNMILLDLHMPRIDGLDVLKEVKGSEELRHIPVVVLTTSTADTDLQKAYENHANSYLVKPVDFSKFTQLMNDLVFYWLGWNKKP